jgi:predicted transcriptional regulator
MDCINFYNVSQVGMFVRVRELYNILSHEWMSIKEISKRSGLPRGTVSKYLKMLEKFELVEKRVALLKSNRAGFVYRKKVGKEGGD